MGAQNAIPPGYNLHLRLCLTIDRKTRGFGGKIQRVMSGCQDNSSEDKQKNVFSLSVVLLATSTIQTSTCRGGGYGIIYQFSNPSGSARKHCGDVTQQELEPTPF